MSFFKPLAYISIPLLFLHSLSANSQLARYYIRLFLYVSTLGVVSLYGALSSIGLVFIGRRFSINYVTARAFYAVAGRAMGISFDVEGEEWLDKARPAVLVGNHQSMLDILYLGRIFPDRAAMVAKKELKWVPFFGQFMVAAGAIFLDRSNNANAIKSLIEAGELMKKRNTSVWLFPEGTRSMNRVNKLPPFKKGAFHLAVQAQVPIVPVICENYSWLYGKGKFESGKIKLRVLPPISTKGLTSADIPELTARAHSTMEEVLQEISTHTEQPNEQPTEAPTRNLGHTMSSDIPVLDDQVLDETVRSSSSASLGRRNSETGSTESDEGMVLVGRPH